MLASLGASLALFLFVAPTQAPAPDPVPPQEPAASGPLLEDLLTHYERVERELRGACVDELPAAVAARRAQAIEWLREYRLRAEFGRNLDFPGERKPYFVDAGGRRCAVAWLLHEDGQDALVERVARAANHAWVIDLAGDPELSAWLDSIGLDLDEAARIQAPGTHGGGRPRPRPWNGPGDTTGGGPAVPSAPSGPSTPAPSGPGPAGPSRPAGPAQTGGGPAGPVPAGGGVPITGVGPEAWWTWWQLHKLDYLRPNLLRNWLTTLTGFTEEGTPHSGALDRVREELRPVLEEALADGDANVRASAAICLGRIAGAEAVGRLRALLSDPSIDVRERALLALGATGSEEAANLLLAVARTGSPDGEAGRARPVTADARALAVLALAVGRRSGLDERVDLELARLALELGPREETLQQASLLLYQTLAPTPALRAWILRRAEDDEAHEGVRCRALETLRTRDDDEALAVLTRELSGRSLERRRSAALALGEFEHDLALPALMTAAELEREPLTRGFVMISIGRQGGEAARELLVEELTEGRRDTRSWCALALGILARGDDDAAARAALRAATAKSKDKSAIGAYFLGLGIAQDAASEPLLMEALVEGSTPEVRSVAAMSLAMIDRPDGRALLRQRLAVDSCSYTRSEIAAALGYLGDERDSPALLAALEDLSDPALRSTTALALGLHGTRPSVEGLIAFGADEDGPSAVRASSFEALQLVLGRSPSLTLGELLRQANFSMFPPTLVRLRDVLL